jgi:hypothetical protein
MIHGARQRLRPPRPRRPDLGPDVFDQRHARQGLTQGLGHPDGEAPAVDQDHGVGPLPDRQSHGVRHPRLDPLVGPETLQPAENGQFGDVERAGRSLGGHLRPADADERSTSPSRAFNAFARPAPSASPEASAATSMIFIAPTGPRPRRTGPAGWRSRSGPDGRSGSACPATPPTPASPAAEASSSVRVPITGMSTRRSWIGLGALPSAPLGAPAEPRRSAGRPATRISMASVPSCASTASTSPSQTTAPCPMSSSPAFSATCSAFFRSASWSAVG